MVNDKKQHEHNINNKDPDEYYFKVWETYEHVAMHFNDWETRDSGAADKAAIQRVRVPPCQLPDSGT